jgi:hypothetical protein
MYFMNGTLKISFYGKGIHIRKDIMNVSGLVFRLGDLSLRTLARVYVYCTMGHLKNKLAFPEMYTL